MAAGNGSRYGALKQFDELGPKNEYLFEFSIFDAIRNDFEHIVIVTKKEFVDQIKKYLIKRLPNNISLDVVAQNLDDLPKGYKNSTGREKPWGTAHAVWAARNQINESFVVINADDFYGNGAFTIATDFIKSYSFDHQFGLVAYALKDTLSDFGDVSRGICLVENNQLIKLSELLRIIRSGHKIIDLKTNTVLSGNEPTSMNLWICKPTVFDAIEKQLIEFLNLDENIKNGELYIPFVIQKMLDEKSIEVKVLSTTSKWFGVTYASDKKQAVNTLMKMTNNKEYLTPLWKI